MSRGRDGLPLETGDYRTVVELSGFPAYVLGPGAELVYANAAALAGSGRVDDTKRAQLAELVRPGGCPPEFRVTNLVVGGRRHTLVTELAADLDLDAGPRAMGVVYGLSERETEVLALLARGYAQQAIGKELRIKVTTVASHVDALRDKLDARNKGEILAKLRAFELSLHRLRR